MSTRTGTRTMSSHMPPTPAPSTDITGKAGANPDLDVGFTLPPAALGSRGSVASSTGPSDAASDSSYRPLSPSSPIAAHKTSSRKRPSTSQKSVVTKDDYSLPPPPTRSRKIIQMKPKDAAAVAEASTPQQPEAQAGSNAKTAAGGASKKGKQNGNTAAGRKIARKTAHSLIERRRRSKMNEEFGVLKDMIPACRDQEMHKLAILQASIEYMRYLEQCVADLKAAHNSHPDSPASAVSELPPPPAMRSDQEDVDDGEDEDEEMKDVTPIVTTVPQPTTSTCHIVNTSPALNPQDRTYSFSHSTTTSPAMPPQDHRVYSTHPSPAIRPSDPHHYTITRSPSILASPAFSAQATPFSNPFPPSSGPAARHCPSGSSHSTASFALTSPALGPQADREDQEATEALMMLTTDRRWSGGGGGRGLSVKDLLSG